MARKREDDFIFDDEEKDKTIKQLGQELEEMQNKRKKKSAFGEGKDFISKIKRQLQDAFKNDTTSNSSTNIDEELKKLSSSDSDFYETDIEDEDVDQTAYPNDIYQEQDSYEETIAPEEDEDDEEIVEESSSTNSKETETEEEKEDSETEENPEEENPEEEGKIEKEEGEETELEQPESDTDTPETEQAKKPEEEGKIEKGEGQTPKSDTPTEQTSPTKDTSTPSDTTSSTPDTTPDTTKKPSATPDRKETPNLSDNKSPKIDKTTPNTKTTPQTQPKGTGQPKPKTQPKIDGPKGKSPATNISTKQTNVAQKKAKEQAQKKAKEQATKKAAEKAAKKATGEVAKKAGGQGIWSLLIAGAPWSFIIIAVILVLLFMILSIFLASAAASFAAPLEEIDPANGQFGSIQGVTGDNFYGARYIYLDQARAEEELESYYYSLATDYINKIDALDIVDAESSVKEATINALTLEIANAVSPLENGENLDDLIASITHFGYTTEQLTDIKTRLTNYLIDNQATIFVSSTDEESFDISNEIITTFDVNYSSLNITAPLYYVKDVILEEGEMIPSQDAKNYVAMIYMPKEDVTFSGASYIFYVPDENTTIDFNFTVADTTKNFSVDKSWYNEEGFIDEETGEKEIAKTADISTNTISLNKFLMIDEENLGYLNDVSIYSVLTGNVDTNEEAENEETSDTPDTEQAEDETTATPEIVNVTITDENKTIFQKYFVIDENNLISWLPTDYEYIRLEFNSNGVFQFCEFDMLINE